MDDASQSSAATGESSATFLKLNEYLSTALPDVDGNLNNDDAATVITNMVDEQDENAPADDQNKDPAENMAAVTTSFSEDGSVDLVYNGMKSVAGHNHNIDHSGMRSVTERSERSSSSRSQRSGSSRGSGRKPLTPGKPKTPGSVTSSKVTMTPKRKPKAGGGIFGGSKDVSLDIVLQRLSKETPEVALPPKAAWESKVKYLAGQIDQERDNGAKLADIEKMLEQKKIRAKQDTEQAKWKSRVRDLEAVLEERRKVKAEKLRKLAVILSGLKKEKAEMKKYEKPCGGSRWASKSHQYAESTPNRPGGPDRSASLVRTTEPRSARMSRKQ